MNGESWRPLGEGDRHVRRELGREHWFWTEASDRLDEVVDDLEDGEERRPEGGIATCEYKFNVLFLNRL